MKSVKNFVWIQSSFVAAMLLEKMTFGATGQVFEGGRA